MLPCFSPSPTPEANGGGGLWGSPPPTLHWTQFSMGQGALWGGSAPLLDPHPTQRGGGGLWGSPPAFNPLLLSLYGAGGLYGVVLPRFWTPPIPMGGSMGQRCPTSTPPNPDLVWGGRLMGQPPLGIEPHPIWGSGRYGAVLPHFWTPPIPMGGSMGQCCPTSAPRYPGGGVVGRPPPLTSNPTLIPIWGSRRYGAAPPPSAPPGYGVKPPPPGCP